MAAHCSSELRENLALKKKGRGSTNLGTQKKKQW